MFKPLLLDGIHAAVESAGWPDCDVVTFTEEEAEMAN